MISVSILKSVLQGKMSVSEMSGFCRYLAEHEYVTMWVDREDIDRNRVMERVIHLKHGSKFVRDVTGFAATTAENAFICDVLRSVHMYSKGEMNDFMITSKYGEHVSIGSIRNFVKFLRFHAYVKFHTGYVEEDELMLAVSTYVGQLPVHDVSSVEQSDAEKMYSLSKVRLTMSGNNVKLFDNFIDDCRSCLLLGGFVCKIREVRSFEISQILILWYETKSLNKVEWQFIKDALQVVVSSKSRLRVKDLNALNRALEFVAALERLAY